MFGKYEHPIKALIESESNQCEKNKTSLDFLFNIEKSSRHSETIMGESDFDTFMAKGEGQEAENDSVQKTFDKNIEHIEFGKEFTITRKMADDAKFGIGANMKARPKKFVRAYYKTRVKLGAEALINAIKPSFVFNRAVVDLTTGDKLPLFHNKHTYFTDKMKGKTQCNYFYGNISESETVFEETLAILANKLRNFKDENGENMGYTADVLVIPCNRPKLEMMAKRVVGSERTTGSNNNDINTQYGNWTLVVLDGWECDTDEIMVISSEANKNLMGNMFFNRVKLDITSAVDPHTRNYFWNGYTRFGVGFGTWKHILRCVNSDTAVTNANALTA
jgi:hypothetical protein